MSDSDSTTPVIKFKILNNIINNQLIESDSPFILPLLEKAVNFSRKYFYEPIPKECFKKLLKLNPSHTLNHFPFLLELVLENPKEYLDFLIKIIKCLKQSKLSIDFVFDFITSIDKKYNSEAIKLLVLDTLFDNQLIDSDSPFILPLLKIVLEFRKQSSNTRKAEECFKKLLSLNKKYTLEFISPLIELLLENKDTYYLEKNLPLLSYLFQFPIEFDFSHTYQYLINPILKISNTNCLITELYNLIIEKICLYIKRNKVCSFHILEQETLELLFERHNIKDFKTSPNIGWNDYIAAMVCNAPNLLPLAYLKELIQNHAIPSSLFLDHLISLININGIDENLLGTIICLTNFTNDHFLINEIIIRLQSSLTSVERRILMALLKCIIDSEKELPEIYSVITNKIQEELELFPKHENWTNELINITAIYNEIELYIHFKQSLLPVSWNNYRKMFLDSSYIYSLNLFKDY